jgi:hypothetical protein
MNKYVLIALFLVISMVGCTDPEMLSNEAKVLSFQFLSAQNPGLNQDISGTINESTKEIEVVFPIGSISSDLSDLVATFTSSPKSTVTANGTVQISGQTRNNFSSTLNFQVTAEDKSVVTYKIKVTKLLSSEAKMLSFQFLSTQNPALKQNVSGSINETSKEIEVVFPVFSITSDLSNLVATFTSSPNSTVSVNGVSQVSGQTSTNFSTIRDFQVTAEDKTVVTYKVKVTKLLSEEAKILSFRFLKNVNQFLNRDIKGFEKSGKKEIVFHNPHLNKTELIADFTISPGATLKVGNTTQVSGTTSNNFSKSVVYTVIAENGNKEEFTISMTRQIVDLEDFLRVCPLDDPNINQILSKFEIRLNGNVVTNFSCAEPYYIMSEQQYTTEKTYLQALRFLFYLDYDNPTKLPWTDKRLFDWVDEKIDGINVKDGISGGLCCENFNGKTFITVQNIKTNTSGLPKSSDRLFTGFGMMNIELLLHEARHVDGFPHTSGCCTSGGACDQVLDLDNPSGYGMMVWWNKSMWEKKYDFGVDCLVNNDPIWKNNIQTLFNPNIWSNFFCNGIYNFQFPANGFSDCEF